MTEPQFEQPDLRTTNQGSLGGSTYQHPHTGQQVPSVTTISGLIDKPHLVPWSAKLAAEFAADNAEEILGLTDRDLRVACIKAGAEKARAVGRDLGSSAHNAIEGLTLGRMTMADVPEDVQHHVAGWSAWVREFVASFLLVEATVWSHRYGYAGTLDAVVTLKDGRVCLVDYKTSKDVYTEAALQLAALRFADCVVSTDGEFAMPRIDCCAVLHLPAPVLTKTGKQSIRGKWSFREVTADAEDFEVFLALQRAYQWEKGKAATVIGGKQTKPAKAVA